MYELRSLRDLKEAAPQYVGLFHEYLLRGGFPQTALMESMSNAQRLNREDIIDKVLKRDLSSGTARMCCGER